LQLTLVTHSSRAALSPLGGYPGNDEDGARENVAKTKQKIEIAKMYKKIYIAVLSDYKARSLKDV